MPVSPQRIFASLSDGPLAVERHNGTGPALGNGLACNGLKSNVLVTHQFFENGRNSMCCTNGSRSPFHHHNGDVDYIPKVAPLTNGVYKDSSQHSTTVSVSSVDSGECDMSGFSKDRRSSSNGDASSDADVSSLSSFDGPDAFIPNGVIASPQPPLSTLSGYSRLESHDSTLEDVDAMAVDSAAGLSSTNRSRESSMSESETQLTMIITHSGQPELKSEKLDCVSPIPHSRSTNSEDDRFEDADQVFDEQDNLQSSDIRITKDNEKVPRVSSDVQPHLSASHSSSSSRAKSSLEFDSGIVNENYSIERPSTEIQRMERIPLASPVTPSGAVLQLGEMDPRSPGIITSKRFPSIDMHEFNQASSPSVTCELKTDNAYGRDRNLSVNEVKEQAIARLQQELKRAQEELKLRDEEVARLSRIRDKVGAELEDLTASLFQEAHNMVREANVKKANAEKALKEANMKIEVLQAEVDALKTLVITSTPSMPNRHLHPQLDPRSSPKFRNKKLAHHDSFNNGTSPNSLAPATAGFFRGHKRSPSHNNLKYGRENSPPGSPEKELHPQQIQQETQPLLCSEDNEMDPQYYKEFVSWRETPKLDKMHPFLARIYKEDILPCLNFSNLELTAVVEKNIEQNSIIIEAVVGKSPFPKRCALLDIPRLCKYRMKLADSDQWHYISHLCRNRITAVCDFLCYLRYIQQGLVKSGVNDVYWEIMRLRKQMALARLGVC